MPNKINIYIFFNFYFMFHETKMEFIVEFVVSYIQLYIHINMYPLTHIYIHARYMHRALAILTMAQYTLQKVKCVCVHIHLQGSHVSMHLPRNHCHKKQRPIRRRQPAVNDTSSQWCHTFISQTVSTHLPL